MKIWRWTKRVAVTGTAATLLILATEAAAHAGRTWV